MARGSFSGIGEHLANPLFVPESLSALQAVSSLKQAGTRTALIVDEYGGITGLVAFSDLVESILGEAASSSGEEPSLVMRENGSWLVDGSIGVDRFVRELGLDTSLLGEGDYETLAGLVLDRMGAIPKAGDTCSWESCSIEVVDMDGNRIDKVIVTIHPKPDSGTAADEGL
jgi:putative hemolysin